MSNNSRRSSIAENIAHKTQPHAVPINNDINIDVDVAIKLAYTVFAANAGLSSISMVYRVWPHTRLM